MTPAVSIWQVNPNHNLTCICGFLNCAVKKRYQALTKFWSFIALANRCHGVLIKNHICWLNPVAGQLFNNSLQTIMEPVLSYLVIGGTQHSHIATPATTAHHRGKASSGVPQCTGELDESHGWVLPRRALLQQQGTFQARLYWRTLDCMNRLY